MVRDGEPMAARMKKDLTQVNVKEMEKIRRQLQAANAAARTRTADLEKFDAKEVEDVRQQLHAANDAAALAVAQMQTERQVGAPLRVQGTIEDRVEGLRRKSMRFPQGQRMPPHLYPLLPDHLFPPTRDTPSPIQPLFPPPGRFTQDTGRYVRNEDYTIANTEVNTMGKLTPSYAMDAQGEKCFFCANGEKYANLRQLHVGLLTMRDEHFRHHVGSGKNDFAAWIAGVFGDQALAAELGKVHSRALTAYKVGQRMRGRRT